MNNKESLIALSTCSFLGANRLNLLVSYFGSFKKLWEASPETLQTLGLGKEKLQEFIKARNNFDLGKYLKSLEDLKIETVATDEKGYPKELGLITNPPLLLYIKGKIPADKTRVAVVGSREMTNYGGMVTEKFTASLARSGIVIVSGLAKGVDTVAHKMALAVKGKTIAVLGCGLDRVYPYENLHLAREIVEKGGALVSEYPLGHPPLSYNFPARNRIISGMSEAVVVIEGKEKSGTLLTASHAAEQGKDVYAVPGPINSPNSGATTFLLKNGAKLASSPEDILEDLKIA